MKEYSAKFTTSVVAVVVCVTVTVVVPDVELNTYATSLLPAVESLPAHPVGCTQVPPPETLLTVPPEVPDIHPMTKRCPVPVDVTVTAQDVFEPQEPELFLV